MSFGSTRVRLLIVAWLLLVGAAVAVGVNAEQNDLGTKAEAELAAAGISAAVEVSGRDVTLTGVPADRDRAEELVGQIDGVRVVNWRDTTADVAAQPEAPATTAPATSAPSTTAAPSTLPPIDENGDTEVAHLDARLQDGMLVLRGTIPDPEVAARLGAVADLIYAPLIDNQIVVDPNVDAASWVPAAPSVIAVLPIVGTSGLSVSGQEATVFGYAPSEERLGQLQGALSQALGPDVTLTSEVVVTGLEPPSINAVVAGDGIIVLTGTVPSQSVVDFAQGLAVESYGAENVVNNIEVDPGVDTTFSLFRLPLVFPAFAPFPEWDVQIYDNVISGQLLNGASFPSGSAELTPQLEQLMPVGTGILTRNPTLVITVEGHTDSIGSAESNQALSEARAEAAKDWFIASGIEPERVFAVGYGETRPIGDNETPEGRAMNRRIEFRLGPPE
ncbi:MAG: OmpA family protein [Acidimicrobiia bacterium]|nr:OmpA family protein [Acidimicrobiia bacterium]